PTGMVCTLRKRRSTTGAPGGGLRLGSAPDTPAGGKAKPVEEGGAATGGAAATVPPEGGKTKPVEDGGAAAGGAMTGGVAATLPPGVKDGTTGAATTGPDGKDGVAGVAGFMVKVCPTTGAPATVGAPIIVGVPAMVGGLM